MPLGRALAAFSVNRDGGRLRSGFVGALLLLPLVSCSVSGDPNIRTTGPGVPENARLTVLEPRYYGDSQQLAARFTSALEARNFEVVDKGDFEVQLTATQRTAKVGLAHETPGQSASEVDIVSEARTGRRLFSCKAQRLRVNLAVLRVSDGSIARLSKGEIDGCRFTDEQIGAFVDELSGQF